MIYTRIEKCTVEKNEKAFTVFPLCLLLIPGSTTELILEKKNSVDGKGVWRRREFRISSAFSSSLLFE